MNSSDRSRPPRIGITLGDPRGIGPEIVGKALGHDFESAVEYLVIGPAGLSIDGHSFHSVGEWDGEVESAGYLSGLAVARAVELALAGEIDAIVTAPIDKSAFHAGGWHFPGHTEMLQDLAGVSDVVMMMAAERTLAGGPLRVVLATTHLALRDVPAAVTSDLIVRQSRLTADSLRRWWGIENPRLALCALNPHASDGGLFGDEERRVLEPAARLLAAGGMSISDPIPADTVFRRTIAGEFDAVIAPYHDVGMAAFKTVAFGGGVNVTLGLPFPRTSPDHGTAIDIAGRGLASESSMIEAISLAIRLARHADPIDDRHSPASETGRRSPARP